MKYIIRPAVLTGLIIVAAGAVMVLVALDPEQKRHLRIWERECLQECRVKRHRACNQVRVRFDRLEDNLERRDRQLHMKRHPSADVRSHIRNLHRDIRESCPAATSRYAHRYRAAHVPGYRDEFQDHQPSGPLNENMNRPGPGYQNPQPQPQPQPRNTDPLRGPVR